MCAAAKAIPFRHELDNRFVARKHPRMRVPHLLFAFALAASPLLADDEEGFVSMFNGKDLTGWKSNEEHPGAFKVEEGAIVVNGERAHLFWEGEEGANPEIKNFIFRAKVKTEPKANSGIYFHTKFQPEGWPAEGYEAQVNASHSDRRKTGSLYAVADIVDFAPHKDGEWFDYEIKVQDKTITVKITPEDGRPTSIEFREPDDWKGPNPGMAGRLLGAGTFALQAHDPESKVSFKDLRFKELD
jgi:Domain of Unknown Function (DUF1080).